MRRKEGEALTCMELETQQTSKGIEQRKYVEIIAEKFPESIKIMNPHMKEKIFQANKPKENINSSKPSQNEEQFKER